MMKENLIRQIENYPPFNEQEEKDKALILGWISNNENAFSRENTVAHITASAWVVNKDRSKVLMVYHNIYNSWSWMGGHADGETDLLSVAIREVKEEAGISNVRPVSEEIFSLESLTVDGHVKKGNYVSSHLHLNITYLLEADSEEQVSVKADEDKARQLQSVIQGFDIEAKIVLRKKYYVVYLKEGSGIVDLLNVCEAPVALMKLENMRIVKEMRNSVNRRVNCETANITKTVNAATRQIEDIEYIRDHYGLENLPETLRQMAEVRLENPDAPLKELGEYLDPPVGKSGVNHRLRKLSELADRIRT